MLPTALILACAAGVACAGAEPKPPVPTLSPSAPLSSVPEPPTAAPPRGKLPTDVQPRHYALELHVDPKGDRFSGRGDIDIDVAHPKRTIYLHGKQLHVGQVSVTPSGGAPIAAHYREVSAAGVAALDLDAVLPAGPAKVHVEWDAAFGRTSRGLYRVQRGGDAYAFTQFEPLAAREAFPSFDEPVFKTPFDVTLVVPDGMVAVANSKETARAGGRVTFARTAPLPTYLVAWAVGPLDVVDAPPIGPNAVRTAPLPFRALAARGRGKELAYAVAHTGELVATLEDWFGIPYPYDKLDIVAVPDREGAMENVGLITFGEFLLLIDDRTATLQQRRAYAGVMAHELAHHWFGDLVTTAWWDDTWLNEGFATWMGTRAVQLWRPQYQSESYFVDRVHDAMGVDALVHARAIRQPIESEHDVINAFDAITYQKGAAVLGMFERWMGKDVFQKGVRAYLTKHAHGAAVADDLLAALSAAAGKDVGAAFRTFLDRPGVPLVEARLACDGPPRVELHQSRYFPLGSSGNPKGSWQLPICVRHPDGAKTVETCTLSTGPDDNIWLATKTCPAWVLPNADAAGYFHFVLPKDQLAALTGKAWPKLTPRERLAVADAARVGFARGTAKAGEVLDDLSPLSSDPFPSVAAAPMGIVTSAREWLFDTPLRPNVEGWARKLYGKTGAALGFGAPKKSVEESPERTFLRQNVLWFLATIGRDPAVRKEAAAHGRAWIGFGKDDQLHPEAVDPNLAGLALSVAAEDGDAKLFDAILAHLARTDDASVRFRLLSAIGAFRDPTLVARAQALTLDERLHTSELFVPLSVQLGAVETRESAWAWLRTNFDAVVARLSPARAGWLPYHVRFCDPAHADEVEAFFSPRIAALEGGPRNLATSLESMRLCIARRNAHDESLRAFFAKPAK
ncbi:MAG: M1 family metallopeptidase [Deltaproteobacteria bacterium]|nr:M1 family metallopeptidase [Deltaproteobacteria bacterium]